MKTRKHKRLDAALLVLFLLAVGGLGYGVYSIFGGSSDGPVEAAALDEAELMFHVHFGNLETSAFARSLDTGQAEDLAGMPPELIRFREALGIGREDLVEGLVSLAGLNAIQEGRFDAVGIAGALRIDAPLTLDRIESAITDAVPAEQRESISRMEIEGRPALGFAVPDIGITVAVAVFERDETASTLYFGDERSLRSTLAKLGTRGESRLPGAMREGKESMMPDSHAMLIVSIPSQAQAQLREGVATSPIPLGPAGDAITTLRRAGLAIRANQSLAVQLVLGLGSAADALAVQTAVNETFLPIAQMAAQQQTGSIPPFLGQPRTEVVDNNFSLFLSLSADEVEQLMESAPQQIPMTAEGPVAGPSQDDPGTAEPETTPWPTLRIDATTPETGEAVINGLVVSKRSEIEGVILFDLDERGVILRRDREYRYVNIGDTVGTAD